MLKYSSKYDIWNLFQTDSLSNIQFALPLFSLILIEVIILFHFALNNINTFIDNTVQVYTHSNNQAREHSNIQPIVSFDLEFTYFDYSSLSVWL